MNTALIIVDIQNDYFPGGARELVGSLEASQQARRLVDHFRQSGQPRFFIQHVAARPGAISFLPGTPGVEIHPSLRPQDTETSHPEALPQQLPRHPAARAAHRAGRPAPGDLRHDDPHVRRGDHAGGLRLRL